MAEYQKNPPELWPDNPRQANLRTDSGPSWFRNWLTTKGANPEGMRYRPTLDIPGTDQTVDLMAFLEAVVPNVMLMRFLGQPRGAKVPEGWGSTEGSPLSRLDELIRRIPTEVLDAMRYEGRKAPISVYEAWKAQDDQ